MKKKLVLIVTALTLCAVMVVGGTLAYLTSRTETLENIFKFDSGGDGSSTAVSIEIAEPKWTPGVNADGDLVAKSNDSTVKYQWNDKAADADGKGNNADISVPITNKKLKDKAGEEKTLWGIQQPFYDASVIDKDPVVANNTNVESYVGVAISLPKSALIKYDDNGDPIVHEGKVQTYGLTWAEFDKIATLKFTTTDAPYLHNNTVSTTLVDLPTDPMVNKGNGWFLTKETNDTRYYVYNTKLDKKNDVAKDWMTNSANKSVSKRVFDVVYVPHGASQATFEGADKVKNLSKETVNPLYDPANPNAEDTQGNVIPQYITKTDNVFLVLRDNSGAPTDETFAPTAESALQLDVRAYGTQATLENDENGVTVAKWTADGTYKAPESNSVVDGGKGPLYALNIAFPGVFL